jgi:hypothetical protein
LSAGFAGPSKQFADLPEVDRARGTASWDAYRGFWESANDTLKQFRGQFGDTHQGELLTDMIREWGLESPDNFTGTASSERFASA